MENHPTTEGDAHGLSPEPAGSKPIDGDRLCRVCDGRKTTPINLGGSQDNWPCMHCQGTGAEPSVASRPGSSALGPPAPDLEYAEQSEAALWAGRWATDLKRLVDAVDAHNAATLHHRKTHSPAAKAKRGHCASNVFHAAICFVSQLRERPEGGPNNQAES